MEERRAFKRVGYQDPIRCLIRNEEYVDDAVINAKNLSGGGMLVLSEAMMKTDQTLSLEILVPGYMKAISARGKVKWTNSLKSAKDDILAGVKFTNIDSYDRQMILDYVHFSE